MNKYERLIAELEYKHVGKMKVHGNSMMPIIKSGSTLTFKKCETYEIGDIVFCRVRGRYIDAHKIIAKSSFKITKYLIANNNDHLNGWTGTIYGKVIEIQEPQK